MSTAREFVEVKLFAYSHCVRSPVEVIERADDVARARKERRPERELAQRTVR